MNNQFHTPVELLDQGEFLLLRSVEVIDPEVQRKFPNLPSANYIAFQHVVLKESDQSKYLIGAILMASRGELDLFFLSPQRVEEGKREWWTQGYECPTSLLLEDRFTLFDNLQQIAQVMPTIHNDYLIYQVVRDENSRALSLRQLIIS